MMAEDYKSVSEATLRRLPSYLHYLKLIQQRDRDVISCSHIGRELGLDPTQVRKDLSVTGIVGKPKVGYDVAELISSIETFLGWHNTTEALLVGVGHLGSALLGYKRFKDCGMNIVAVFDSNPEIVGTTIHGREVLPVEKMPGLAQRMHIQMGILAVPAEHSQEVADRMVEGDIRGIWNFAPKQLHVPDGVVVQNEDIYSGLAVLMNRMAEVR